MGSRDAYGTGWGIGASTGDAGKAANEGCGDTTGNDRDGIVAEQVTAEVVVADRDGGRVSSQVLVAECVPF